MFLSAIGIYGVLAYLVTQRRREIGIRAALGCTTGGVVKLVVREALWLLGAGLILGVAGSVALWSIVAGQLYGVKPLDPVVISAVILTLSVVGLRAAGSPGYARRSGAGTAGAVRAGGSAVDACAVLRTAGVLDARDSRSRDANLQRSAAAALFRTSLAAFFPALFPTLLPAVLGRSKRGNNRRQHDA